jgi:hypothetical protein
MTIVVGGGGVALRYSAAGASLVSAQSKLGRTALGRLSRLHAAQRARCFYCEKTMTLRLAGEPVSFEDATIDHFFPKSEGGLHGWRNWVLACRACNNKKASRQPTEAEMLAWNELASVWPHIRPIDLGLVRKKRCAVCQRWISPMRLGDSLASGCETETCRPRCGRRRRAGLREADSAAVATAPLPVAPGGGGRAWWVRVLGRLRRYFS